MNMGYLYLRQGDIQKSIEYLERGLQLSRSRDLSFITIQISAILGYAYLLCDRMSEAEELLPGAAEQAVERGMTLTCSLYLAWLAELHLRAGRVVEALREGNRALAVARKHGEEGDEGWVLCLLAEVHKCCDRDGILESKRYYLEALSRATLHHMRPLAAQCHLGLGQLLARLGAAQQAREHFDTAVQMFREMGMQYWLEKAQLTQKTCSGF